MLAFDVKRVFHPCGKGCDWMEVQGGLCDVLLLDLTFLQENALIYTYN